MKNGDYIRAMDNDRLSRFLWIWSINTVSSFLQHGGTQLMDARQLEEWMDKDEFVCVETEVGKDFIFDQDFNLKE